MCENLDSARGSELGGSRRRRATEVVRSMIVMGEAVSPHTQTCNKIDT